MDSRQNRNPLGCRSKMPLKELRVWGPQDTKMFHQVKKQGLRERRGPEMSGALPCPQPRMCPAQRACCSPISCARSPAHQRFPGGNRRANQRAAFGCRTKTKQFGSRCQRGPAAPLAANGAERARRGNISASTTPTTGARPCSHYRDYGRRGRER